MAVVRPPMPTDSFPNTTGNSSNHGYFLALRLDEITRAADEQATCRLWKCSYFFVFFLSFISLADLWFALGTDSYSI